MSPKNQRYQSRRHIERKRKVRIITISIIAVILLGLIALLIWFSGHHSMRVERIIMNDTEYIERTDIELLAKEKLEGRYLGIIARSNTFLSPRRVIQRTILEQYPAAKTVKVQIRGLHTLRITIEEYTAVARWCDVVVTPAAEPEHVEAVRVARALPQVVTNKQQQHCFFISDSAYVFADAPKFSVDTPLSFYGTIVGNPLRQQYASANHFADLLEFEKLLRRLQITTKEVWTVNGDVYAFVTDTGAMIYIDIADPIVTIFNNLETVIARDAINRAQFANIAYIDLRFGNRVFYKLR